MTDQRGLEVFTTDTRLRWRDVFTDQAETSADKGETWTPYVKGTRQGQWLTDWSYDDQRWHFTSLARMVAGMAAPSTEYADLIAPGETLARRKSMAAVSGCMLAVRGLLRLFGVAHDRLATPYVTGRAFDDLATIGTTCERVLPSVGGPRVNHRAAEPLISGAIVIVGRGKRTHVAVVIHVTPSGKVWTIDGGQTNAAGRQCILWRERQLQTVAGLPMLGDREIIKWMDPAGFSPLVRLEWRAPTRDAAPLPPPPNFPE